MGAVSTDSGQISARALASSGATACSWAHAASRLAAARHVKRCVIARIIGQASLETLVGTLATDECADSCFGGFLAFGSPAATGACTGRPSLNRNG